jgi:hypothetical protein
MQFHQCACVNISGKDPFLVLFARILRIITCLLPLTHTVIDLDLISSSIWIFSSACVTLSTVHAASVWLLRVLDKETRYDRYESDRYLKSTSKACGVFLLFKRPCVKGQIHDIIYIVNATPLFMLDVF